jgi:hypothetical protein
MSADQPMAVVAPSMDGDIVSNAAHVPEVEGQSSSDDDEPLGNRANGNGIKRAPRADSSDLSSEDEQPLVSDSKSPRENVGRTAADPGLE